MTTPIYGLPYQGLTDSPNGASLGADLALAVETELARIDADIAAAPQPFQVASSYKTSGDLSVAVSTQAVAHSVTFTAVAGQVYVCTWIGTMAGSNAANQAFLDIRHAAGSSITTASTAAGDHTLYNVNGANFRTTGMVVEREFTASASGTYTVGLTVNFFGGAGTMTLPATANDVSRIKVTRTA